MSNIKEVVLLQSGGLDSNIVAAVLKKRGYRIHHLFVDYGQNQRNQELKMARRIHSHYNKLSPDGYPPDTLQVATIELPWFYTSTVMVGGQKVDDFEAEGVLNTAQYGTYIPLRNLIFLSLAASLAESLEITDIAMAFDGSQTFWGKPFSGTTDKHPKFVKRFAEAATEGSVTKHIRGKRFNFITPVMDMYKHEIIQLGVKVGAAMELSWSCYNSDEKPCLNCSACKVRAQGFYNAGVEDPLLKAFGLDPIPPERL